MNAKHSQVASSHQSIDLTPYCCLSMNAKPSPIYQDSIEEGGIILRLSGLPKNCSIHAGT